MEYCPQELILEGRSVPAVNLMHRSAVPHARPSTVEFILPERAMWSELAGGLNPAYRAVFHPDGILRGDSPEGVAVLTRSR